MSLGQFHVNILYMMEIAGLQKLSSAASFFLSNSSGDERVTCCARHKSKTLWQRVSDLITKNWNETHVNSFLVFTFLPFQRTCFVHTLRSFFHGRFSSFIKLKSLIYSNKTMLAITDVDTISSIRFRWYHQISAATVTIIKSPPEKNLS